MQHKVDNSILIPEIGKLLQEGKDVPSGRHCPCPNPQPPTSNFQPPTSNFRSSLRLAPHYRYQ